MWSFYVFMMWFLSITLWKNIIGAIFAKIWKVVTFFGHAAHKPVHLSPDEADSAHKPEHPSQGEADSAHAQNVHDREALEMLLSEFSDVGFLRIEICVHSIGGLCFSIGGLPRGSRILKQIGEHKTYFAVLDHISSSMTIKSLDVVLSMQDEVERPNDSIAPLNTLHLTSEDRQKELSDDLEAFWKALASNKSLKSVCVIGGSLHEGKFIRRERNAPYEKVLYGVEIANWIAKVLYENKTISHLALALSVASSVDIARILSKALLANQSLNALYLSTSSMMSPNLCGEGMKILLEPFIGRGDTYNSVLEHLFLDDWPVDDNGVEHIAAMLMVNDSIKSISFNRADGRTQNGVSKIGDALCNINRSLQKLELNGIIIHLDECKGLFKPLMRNDFGFQANTSLRSLSLRQCELGQVGFECLIAMIERNASLIDLDVDNIDVFRDSFDGCENNMCLLLDSLKGHPSIESLSLCSNTGVQGDKVLGTFMDLLLENNHIQEVHLYATPLEKSGNAQKIYTELERRREENSWEVIKDMAKANANLSGRIFLCGDGEAGKTTLCSTMKEIYEMKILSKQESSQSKIPPLSSQTKMDENERTRGIEVHNLSYNDLDLTIWDMAGQEEYHSFHDLVIPNLSGAGSACTFILVCKLEDTLVKIKSKLQYWLQFIASNTRKSRLYQPRIIITMTHYDLRSREDDLFYYCLGVEVESLKKQFKDLLAFDDIEFDNIDKSFCAMDARQSNGVATDLFEFMIDQMKSLLEKLPKGLKACSELQKRVKDWNIQHPNQPFLSWDEFSCICEQVEELKAIPTNMELVERRRKLAALSLHDGGHIIYNEDVQFVIMNPHWFCHDVMGQLLSKLHEYGKSSHYGGIMSKGSITSVIFKRVLSRLEIIGDEDHAHTKDFVNIMTKLQICYDQGDDTFMVPSILPQREVLLKWSFSGDTTKTNYIGRRLALEDMQRTILSAGFFPRLQVFFQEKMEDDNTKKSYKLTRDTISFIENGKEVIIQYDGHIDVMVRSIQKKDILLRFLHEVLSVIHELLGNPTLGCPGVVLVECVLRPLCVQKLIKKEHRRDQFVLLESLKGEVLKRYDLTYNHNWIDSEELAQGFDNASDLLGQGEWNDVLKRRQEALREIGTQVLSSLPSTSVSLDSKDHGTSESELDEEAQDPTLSRIHSLKKIMVGNHFEHMSAIDEMKSSLDEIKSSLDEIKTVIQQQDKMLYGIYASINELMQFSVELQKAQIPRIACLAIHTEPIKRQVFRRIIPELTTCDLHFFCEHIHGIHEVVGQTGLRVYFGTRTTKKVLTLLARGLKIATILTKVAAHVAGGMGSLVPDLAQGAALILDTPGLLDHQLGDTSSVHILSEYLGESEAISDEDMKDAERWLINEVSRVSNIHAMFKLNKVKYRRRDFGDQMKTPSIAWVCDKHKDDGVSDGSLEPLSYC